MVLGPNTLKYIFNTYNTSIKIQICISSKPSLFLSFTISTENLQNWYWNNMEPFKMIPGLIKFQKILPKPAKSTSIDIADSGYSSKKCFLKNARSISIDIAD